MGGLWRHQYRRTTLWLIFFVSLLAGLAMARVRAAPEEWTVLCTAAILVVYFPRRGVAAVVFVALLGALCGWWRGTAYIQKLASLQVLYYQDVTITAVAREDAIYGRTKQLTFNVSHVSVDGDENLTGQLQLSGYGVNAVFQGDVVEATGKLYPGFGSYQGSISFAHLTVLERHPTIIAELKRRFVAGAQSALPEPLAPFVMGLLIGQRATLPDSVKDDLKKVGLTHIIAVSGANLTILLRASQRVLGKRSKRLSTLLTAGLTALFLALTGLSASIVRAAMVSLLSLTASYYGRRFKPLNLILLTAAITAWANPVYLWSDLGWYLSFLAFFGVMVLSPLVQARWPARWLATTIGGVALESICAEIMTLPFVLYIFGQMSRVGLIANVLVVAFIPLAMLLGAISGLAGMLMPSLAGWITWPAVWLLDYMLDTAHVLAGLPHVFVQGIGLGLAQVLLLYGCIGLITSILWFKNSDKSAIITDINMSKMRGFLT